MDLCAPLDHWPFCGLPVLLPLHYSDPTYRITRDTQFPYLFTCYEAYYSGLAPHAIFYQIASHLSGQGLKPPARELLLPHRRAGPRDSAKWGCAPESCYILVRR
jgi:hypothetical protein